jgi:outer membrane immunogenic protein
MKGHQRLRHALQPLSGPALVVAGVAAAFVVLGLVALTARPAGAEEKAPAWTGPWIGAHIGAAAVATEIDGVATLAGDGLLGGLSAGFDVKAGQIVAGVWGEYTFADLQTSLGGDSLTLEGAWAAGLRLGWLVNPRLLAYGRYGWTSAQASASFGAIPDLDGTVLAFGLEGLLPGDTLSAKVEYVATELGTGKVGGGTLSPDHHAIRLGVTWRFSFGNR